MSKKAYTIHFSGTYVVNAESEQEAEHVFNNLENTTEVLESIEVDEVNPN